MNELYHYNHNHYGKGPKGGQFAPSVAGAARFVGSAVLSMGKKKKKPPEADIKTGKAANTKLSDDERNRLVKSGTKEEITANKDRLSNKELKAALDRLESETTLRESLEQRLSTLNGEDAQAIAEAGKTKVDKLIETAGKINQYKETGIKAWNLLAKAHNISAAEDDKWPTFDSKGDPQSNGTAPDTYELITKGAASDILKNRDKLTVDQLQESINRREKYAVLEKYAAQESAAKAQADKKAKDEKVKDKDSRSATYIYENAKTMSTEDLDRAIRNYEDSQRNISDRQQKIDKIRQYAEAEQNKKRQDRINNIPVDYWVNHLDEGYYVTNGKVFKKKALWKRGKNNG